MRSLDAALAATAALLAAALVLRAAGPRSRAAWATVALLGASLAAAVALRPHAPPSALAAEPALPGRTPRGEAVSSDACRSCHPGEHASFSRTFHRTMTRAATPEAVLAPSAHLELDGLAYDLARDADGLVVAMPDPDALADAKAGGAPIAAVPRVTRRALVTTGSHHHQGYWVAGRRVGELRLVPFVYLLDEKRFLPRRDVFVEPPDADARAVRWNSNCALCHTTRARPRHDEQGDVFRTEAVELGIACEACHGPGGAHVEKHRAPLDRWLARQDRRPDPTIVNPARLPADRASMICGQCHSYAWPKDEDAFWRDGYTKAYRPGDDLAGSRTLLSRALLERGDGPGVDLPEDSLFFGDGTIRVAGRELHGLLDSPCFVRGEGARKLSCLSCHALHAGDPDDMLRPDRPGDEACLACHAPVRARVAEHTRHAEGSPGRACVACHMPRTTYALLGAIAQHRVGAPTEPATLDGTLPNACTLCHVDRPLAWARRELGRFTTRALPEVADTGVAAVVEDALRGDAGKRALAAAALGWKDSRAAAGLAWRAPVLAELLADDYAAVRIVAWKALVGLPGYEDLPFELATSAPRDEARASVLARFARAPRPAPDPAVLIGADGAFERERAAAILARRDRRPVTLAE